MLKLPTRVQLAIGTLIAGGVALTQELDLSQPVHKLILLVAGVALLLLNPSAQTAEEALSLYPPAGASVTATPPAPAPASTEGPVG